MQCPRCGAANPDTFQFCASCHQTLLYRCPACWNMQPHGRTCDKCGTNMLAYWETYLLNKGGEQEREVLASLKRWLAFLGQLLLLPFSGLRGLLRSLLLRVAGGRFFRNS